MGVVLAAHIPELSLLLGLLACSAFFSGSETALFSLTREQLRHYERQEHGTGAYVVHLLARPKMLLATVLVGNTVVNVLFYSISFRLAQEMVTVSAWAGTAVGIGSFFLVIVFGEVSPKGLAVAHPEAWARLAAIPLYGFARLARPAATVCVAVVRIVSERVAEHAGHELYVNADELKMLVEMAEKQRILDSDKRSMIQNVVDLSRTRVKQIMVPRVDMALFQLNAGREEFLDLVRTTRHKRYPVYTETIDDVSGVLMARDVLLNADADLKSLVRPVTFVPETKTVEALLRQFREQRLGFFIVVDEYGGTAGMVTIEDVLEEVVGEIEDEYDQPEHEVEQIGPDTYRLPGNLGVSAWRDMFGLDLPQANVDTVGGLVTALLGTMPKAQDSVRLRGIEFTVESMRRRRVEWVRLRRLPADDEEGSS
jgi:putative hemolysin